MLVDPGAVHVCYCHNPFRYAWTEREATLRGPQPARRARRCGVLLNRWRQWDWIAAQRVDRYVANSHLTAARVRRYFGREATVLHPPVELERFAPGRRRSATHYLVLAELMAHKRIDVAVARVQPRSGCRSWWSATGRRGGGCGGSPGRPCASPAGITDERVADAAARARARWWSPPTEEFGIAAVEALAAGRPVIALGAGGVRESVARGRDRRVLRARRPGGAGRGGAALRPAGGRSGAPAVAAARALRRPSASRTSCARSSPRRRRDERAPRPGERPRSRPACCRRTAGASRAEANRGMRAGSSVQSKTSRQRATKSRNPHGMSRVVLLRADLGLARSTGIA